MKSYPITTDEPCEECSFRNAGRVGTHFVLTDKGKRLVVCDECERELVREELQNTFTD